MMLVYSQHDIVNEVLMIRDDGMNSCPRKSGVAHGALVGRLGCLGEVVRQTAANAARRFNPRPLPSAASAHESKGLDNWLMACFELKHTAT